MKTVGASVGFVVLQLMFVQAPSAWAQSTPPAQLPGPAVSEASWRMTGGRDVVALRDIARTGTPVDASPVAWQGDGPTFLLQHTRVSGRRTHRFELSATHASHFVYKTPLESLARPEGDSFGRVEGRYEYRRDVFSNVLVRGLDIGAGVQAGGSRVGLTRRFSEGIEAVESRTAFVIAVVTSVRFRRESRFGLEVGWANGGHVGRSSERHSVDSAANRTQWGGGWLTDLVLGADVSVSPHTSIALQYVRTDDGLLSSHRHFASARRSVTVGVTYAK